MDVEMLSAWGASAAIVIVLVVVRTRIVGRLKSWAPSEWWLGVGEVVFTLLAGWYVAWFKVWDYPKSWSKASDVRESLFALLGVLMSAFLGFFAK